MRNGGGGGYYIKEAQGLQSFFGVIFIRVSRLIISMILQKVWLDLIHFLLVSDHFLPGDVME